MMTKRRRIVHTFGLLTAVVLLAALLAACGDDDDDPTATSTPPTGADATATATDAAPDASPTESDSDEATATLDPTPTVESATDATPTPTEAAEPTATPTEEAEATEDDAGDMTAPELSDLTTVVDNFTFLMEGVITADEAMGPQEIVLEIQQHASDNYYMLTKVGGELGAEVWLIGSTAYFRSQGTGVQEIPGADPAMLGVFSPAIFLESVQDDRFYRFAEQVDRETVNGRETTQYRLDAAAYARAFEEEADESITNVAGEGAQLWVDDELGILIRAELDVAFTTADGEEVETRATWNVTDIGSTPEVTVPE